MLPIEKLCSEADWEEAESGCGTPVHLVNRELRRGLTLPCRRRRCEWCGPHLWKPRVQARMMNGLDGVPREEVLLLTLTAPGPATDSWNELASRRLNRFITALRRTFPGAQIAYWKVGEKQKRGLIHYHIIIRGLRYLPHKTMRKLAVRTGFGPRVGVMHPEPKKGGMRGLLGYFGKYLVKGLSAWDEPSHVVTMARSWCLSWRSRGRTSFPSPWHWVPDELAGRWLLRRLVWQAVRESRGSVPEPSSAHARLLTAGLSPPILD